MLSFPESIKSHKLITNYTSMIAAAHQRLIDESTWKRNIRWKTTSQFWNENCFLNNSSFKQAGTGRNWRHIYGSKIAKRNSKCQSIDELGTILWRNFFKVSQRQKN